MSRIFILLFILLLPISAEAKTHTITVNSDIVSNEDVEIAKTQAYENAKIKASEQVGVYIEATTKVKNLAFDDELVVSTTASIQKILKKDFTVFTENNVYNVICKLIVEFDDETLEKALDKSKAIAEKEFYKEMNSINEKSANVYKEQSINPTSFNDTDIQNLYKQAKVEYNSENYSLAIQYLNQILNVQTTQSDLTISTYELLCTSYAYIGEHQKAVSMAQHLLTISPHNYYGNYTIILCSTYTDNYKYEALNAIKDIGKHSGAHQTIRPFMRVNTIKNRQYTWEQIGEYTYLATLVLCRFGDIEGAKYFCSTSHYRGDIPENMNVLTMYRGEQNYKDGFQTTVLYVEMAQSYVNAKNGDWVHIHLYPNVEYLHPDYYRMASVNPRLKKSEQIFYLRKGLNLCKQHPTRLDYNLYAKWFVNELSERGEL